MSDVKNIAVGNTVLDIKDDEARDQISELSESLTHFWFRKSNTISQPIASGAMGYIPLTFTDTPPTGYILTSRQFLRSDNGGYNIILDCPIGVNYLAYHSTGSAPTLTGYVIDTYAKISWS